MGQSLRQYKYVYISIAIAAIATMIFTPHLVAKVWPKRDPSQMGTLMNYYIGYGVAFMFPFILIADKLAAFVDSRQQGEKHKVENVATRRIRGIFWGYIFIFGIFAIPNVIIRQSLIKANPKFEFIYLPILLGSVYSFVMYRREICRFIARASKSYRLIKMRKEMGRGGSAEFGSIFDEWEIPYDDGKILLGSSLFEKPITPATWEKCKNIALGTADDRHLVTIAGTRSGKGRSVIIPNLITWPSSALVIDPKGTNAAVTVARRGEGNERISDCLGQTVHVLDPFGVVKEVKSASFNPLGAIDVNSPSFMEDVMLVADAIVVPEPEAEHWDEGARTIIGGMIAHLLTCGGDEVPTLLELRWMLTQGGDTLTEIFEEMSENTEGGGLPRAAAAMHQNAGGNEWGSFMSTTLKNTKWLDSKAMETILDHSDFNLDELKNGNTTVYVVLPPHMLEEHKRFLRMFINLSIRSMSQGEIAQDNVLFLLDEFYALGKLTQIEKAAGLMAGYKIKLWPILQNLTQLKELYPQNWEAFMSSAGTVQFFGINDLDTEEYLQRRMGQIKRDVMIDNRMQRVTSNLRESSELEREISRESGRQIVLQSGGKPLIIRRMNYDQTFPYYYYSPDPDFPEARI